MTLIHPLDAIDKICTNIAAMLLLFVLSLTGAFAQTSLKVDTPQGWVSKPPASAMRVAEFTLPRATKDGEDAELAIFFFGGQGGSVQANIDRWIGQMTQPDGRASKELAKTTTMQTKSGLTGVARRRQRNCTSRK